MDGAWVNILSGFKDIFAALFKDLSIWWLLTPVIFFWLVLEVYFSMYKGEKLGWNTALGNGLNLFWIVVISLKALFEKGLGLFSIDKLIVVIIIAIYSLFIIFVSFTHKLKERVFFLLASPTVIYYFSGVAILWIYGLIDISFWVVIDLIIFYVIVLILELILRNVIPTAYRDSELEDTGIGSLDIGKDIRGPGMGNLGRGMGRI